MSENRCLFCWEIIPEGRQVCPACYRAQIERAYSANNREYSANIRQNEEKPLVGAVEGKRGKEKMINWKVRFANDKFWYTVIPALALVVTCALDIFGITVDLSEIVQKILNLLKAVFAVLALVGVVNDPTTDGLKDSERAMTYKEPYKDSTDED